CSQVENESPSTTTPFTGCPAAADGASAVGAAAALGETAAGAAASAAFGALASSYFARLTCPPGAARSPAWGADAASGARGGSLCTRGSASFRQASATRSAAPPRAQRIEETAGAVRFWNRRVIIGSLMPGAATGQPFLYGTLREKGPDLPPNRSASLGRGRARERRGAPLGEQLKQAVERAGERCHTGRQLALALLRHTDAGGGQIRDDLVRGGEVAIDRARELAVILEGGERGRGQGVDRIGPDQLVDVERVGIGGIFRAGRRPEHPLRLRLLQGREARPAEDALEGRVGLLGVGDGRLAAQ